MAYIIDSELMKTQRPFYIRFAQYYSLYLFPRGRGFLFLTCARANALASPLFSPFPHLLHYHFSFVLGELTDFVSMNISIFISVVIKRVRIPLSILDLIQNPLPILSFIRMDVSRS